ncbi:MAG: lipopolysaccharide heptosyltransferase I [Limnobacter sp.]|nr:lipopolysaccharide heptosyltransferase I [Limnobacter sp.]
MRIALVKTSSMGDVIHALPVVTDIVRALPQAQVDWIVEEAFAELPALHPSVREVVPVAVRRWRRSPFASETRREIAGLRKRLRSAGYQCVLELQGLLKSAWIGRMAGTPMAGFSRRCAREPLAALACRHRYDVDMSLHAIERLRSLAAQALGYRVEGLPVFGLAAPRDSVPGLPAPPYALLLHATSRAEKLWPESCWRELIGRLADQGIASALPWGSAEERERAVALAGEGGRVAPQAAIPAVVLPRLTLRQCAAAIARAELVVGVDTGLTHLAAALDVPTVALFAATPAWRFGPYWTPRATGLGEDGRWPDADEVLAAAARVRATL